ncbi:AAA family ATPase [Methylobacterium soli]|uniref:AAA family ATPase n=1 Tax=Methylobacterium soli TaxID=553447 RepID=A0A6L3T330_9HYPH|nr:AAA family ATPase [Methylobacterium soli]KAB1080552.1 AAA family ATPase [Methylobacterium soli]GJE45426.1 ATP-dependent zinc metalloprotease FtsH [Methylobacterium soli]
MAKPVPAADAISRALVRLVREEVKVRGLRRLDDPDAYLDGLAEADAQADDAPAWVTPDALGAAVLLGRAMAAGGLGLEGLRQARTGIIVRVPAASWVKIVGKTLKICAFGSPDAGRDGDCMTSDGWAPGRREPVVFLRDGASSSHRPDKGNEAVGDALQAGVPVIGIASDPARVLPADLVRAAEIHLTLMPFDASGIALAVTSAVGAKPRRKLRDDLAATCDLADLRLALLPGRDAHACMVTLEKLLLAKRSMRPGPRLEELHGYGEAKDWGLALVGDLQHWRNGRISFEEIETSILLSGPPGVGKTRYAAALARSAGLPLLAGSLGQWQADRDGHLGHTLGAMRAFFDFARRQPCVALIDEIDSFGDRNKFGDDHKEYCTQVVNALLEHLDGATSREGVIVVAATNNPEAVDPAIRRAGRLDRHVRIGVPDADALRGIFRTYLGASLPGADLASLAVLARGMTGADVVAAVRRARAVARHARRDFAFEDLVEAIEAARPPLPPHIRLRTAIHEAGHGLACVVLGDGGPVELSLHADGGTAELRQASELGDQTETAIERVLVIALAGRAAEEEAVGDVSAGAMVDLAFATRVAAQMEARWGFSRAHPLVSIGFEDQVDVARLPWLIAPVQERLQAAYNRARELVATERHALGRLSEALFREGRLDDRRVRALVAGTAASTPPDARKDRTAV